MNEPPQYFKSAVVYLLNTSGDPVVTFIPIVRVWVTADTMFQRCLKEHDRKY